MHIPLPLIIQLVEHIC